MTTLEPSTQIQIHDIVDVLDRHYLTDPYMLKITERPTMNSV